MSNLVIGEIESRAAKAAGEKIFDNLAIGNQQMAKANPAADDRGSENR
jgi:hypothetical protein